MIPKECKRLAEVDFPIAVVSKHAASEKYNRQGHPSTLHLWWARRPLGACRAMLMALLLPDPCDPLCPSDFKKNAQALLPKVQGAVGPNDEDLRQALLKFIGDFAKWELSADRTYLDVSRALVKAAYPTESPVVVDPFAGAGSIPIEALRLGCDSVAGELNEVATLILKVLLEDIPRLGHTLAEEARNVAAKITEEVDSELRRYYPVDPEGTRPITYLWARTITCESPTCGGEIPLIRSFWLCKKANRKYALRYKTVRSTQRLPVVHFEIFEPKSETEVPVATVSQAKARCLCCGSVLSEDRVRAQLRDQHGGADVLFDKGGTRVGGARLLAVVTMNPHEQGRHYRLPTDYDYKAVWAATTQFTKIVSQGVSLIPNELIELTEIRRISTPLYGATTWGNLFSKRQSGTCQ